MSPQLTSALGALFVLVAGVQVWLMLEATGRREPKFDPSVLRRLHRVTGYAFVALYLVFLVIMVGKVAASNAPLDVKTIIHMTMGISILPLLLVKILIVRFYPRASNPVVPMIGIAIFTLVTTLVSITGGYYFIKSVTTTYVSTFDPSLSYLDVDVGRHLLIDKCHRCHDLTGVFTMVKTPGEWKETVNRMAERDPTWISPGQIDQIVYFLSERQNINKAAGILTVQIETLMDTKCSRCHNIERVFAARRSRQEGRTLVTRMSNRHRSWISDTEAKLIGDYLIDVYGVKKETEVKKAALIPAVFKQKVDFEPLYQNLGCVFCHGKEGFGEGPGTPDWTSPQWQDEHTDQELADTIRDGKGQMPRFQEKLTPEEISAAVRFIRGFRGTN